MTSRNCSAEKPVSTLLASAIALCLFGFARSDEAGAMQAQVLVVQNCDDGGSGSLREALSEAQDNDTVDLTQLTCSRITLTTGAIVFDQANLSIQGPGAQRLAIDGNNIYPLLRLTRPEKNYIDGLTLEHGALYVGDSDDTDALGGCIYARGLLYLTNSVVSDCTAGSTGTTHVAKGGGVFAFSGMYLSNSRVTGNAAIGPQGRGGGIAGLGQIRVGYSFVGYNYASSFGGGVYAYDSLSFKYSTLDHNHAVGDGGGAWVANGTAFRAATISANVSEGIGGGVISHSGPHVLYSPEIYSSTISGNHASSAAGIDFYGGRIAYSTIASNSDETSSAQGAGLRAESYLYLQNTIIATNTDGGGSTPDDVGGLTTATVTGHHNLIGYATISVPADTIIAQDPLLGPLAWNGGTTKTHALLAASPAIDVGGGALYPLTWDQRGVGFPRVIGSSADIGAYEFDNDAIFASGFE